MTMQAFTSNFADNSTEAGFQFTFFCDNCRDGHKTRFIESSTYKKGQKMKGLGNAARIGASLLGKHSAGWQIDRAANAITGRFKGMSPEWHKEHEKAFQIAQNEAKGYFHRCPKCYKWVCEMDWNEQEGLCVKDAPRVNVEVASARSSKMVKDIQEKADQTRVFDGEIESKQTICPNCGKPSGEGKFCNNCGSNLALVECERCGTKVSTESRFCGECGNRLE